MDAAGQSVTVDLKTMTKSRLDDAFTSVDLRHETIEVGVKVLVNLGHIIGDDCTEQHSTEPRCGIDGKDEIAEREPPRRRHRPRVPDFDFGEDVRSRRRQGRLRSNRCTIR